MSFINRIFNIGMKSTFHCMKVHSFIHSCIHLLVHSQILSSHNGTAPGAGDTQGTSPGSHLGNTALPFSRGAHRTPPYSQGFDFTWDGRAGIPEDA